MNHFLKIPAQKFTGKARMINFYFLVDALRVKESEKLGTIKKKKTIYGLRWGAMGPTKLYFV